MQEDRYTLPLRKGGEADVRRALGFLDRLDLLLSHHPQEFYALLAIAEGRTEEASQEHIASLQRMGYLTHEGVLLPERRAVLLSAFEVAGDGPVIAMPFDLRAESAEEIIGRVQQQMHRDLRTFLRDGPDGLGR